MAGHRIAIEGFYSFTPEQLGRVRDEGFEVRGLMARRSPDPEGETIIVPRPGLAVIEFHVLHRRTVVEVRCGPANVESIRYRTDRVGD